jgi:hypothetical protein
MPLEAYASMSAATARPEALAKGMVVCKRAMPLKRDEEKWEPVFPIAIPLEPVDPGNRKSRREVRRPQRTRGLIVAGRTADA